MPKFPRTRKVAAEQYPKKIRSFFLLGGFSLLALALDRATKLWAETRLEGQDIPIWGDFVRFTLTYNTDLAFSIPFPRAAQIALSGVLLLFITWYFWRDGQLRKWINLIAAALIFGGALGNLVDRVLFQRVTDFIAVGNFPVFNLADTFLFLGAAVLIGQELWSAHQQKMKTRSS